MFPCFQAENSLKRLSWPNASLHDRCSRAKTWPVLRVTKDVKAFSKAATLSPEITQANCRWFRTTPQRYCTIKREVLRLTACMWRRPLVGISRKALLFRDNNSCEHKNSAGPHSPHGFVMAHIHSVARGAQQWRRTKNVRGEERNDEKCGENKTCGSCFPLPHRPSYLGKECYRECLYDRRTSNGCFWSLNDYKISVFRPWYTGSQIIYTTRPPLTLQHTLYSSKHTLTLIALTKAGHECLCPSSAIFF